MLKHWIRNYANKKTIRSATKLTESIRNSYAVNKSMRVYRKKGRENGTCRCFHCGSTRNIHIHHIYPVCVAPELAGDPSNFLFACAKHHLVLCHNGNWKNYVENLDQISFTLKHWTTRTQENEI